MTRPFRLDPGSHSLFRAGDDVLASLANGPTSPWLPEFYVTVYFSNIQPQRPFLHEPRCWMWFGFDTNPTPRKVNRNRSPGAFGVEWRVVSRVIQIWFWGAPELGGPRLNIACPVLAGEPRRPELARAGCTSSWREMLYSLLSFPCFDLAKEPHQH